VGKYAEGTNVLAIEPDITKIFADHDSVNQALRSLVEIIRRQNNMNLESTARPIGHISLHVKLAGKRSVGNLHAAFDVAGTGNVALANAPVLDPT
jgi:hypothetical protein